MAKKEISIEQLMMEAQEYPIILRTAARLHLEGVTYEMFHSGRGEYLKRFSDPVVGAIGNHLRTMEIDAEDRERDSKSKGMIDLDRKSHVGIRHRSLRQLAMML